MSSKIVFLFFKSLVLNFWIFVSSSIFFCVAALFTNIGKQDWKKKKVIFDKNRGSGFQTQRSLFQTIESILYVVVT